MNRMIYNNSMIVDTSFVITNNIIGNIIALIHITIILFEILAPFTNNLYLLLFHIYFTVGLIMHWIINSDVCCLTVLEANIRNIDIHTGFIHNILSPFFLLPNNEYFSKIIWIITIILLLISINKVYHKLYKLWKKEYCD